MRHDLKKIAGIKWMLNLKVPVTVISEKLEVPVGTINLIKQGKTHKEVEPAFPEELLVPENIVEEPKVAPPKPTIKKIKRPVIRRQ